MFIKPMTILMRHGETDWNKTSRLMSRTDMPLSPQGVEQVVNTAKLNRKAPVSRIYTSPLLRARQTAQIMQEYLNGEPAITVDERLREIDFGEFEGFTGSQINTSKLSEDFASWQAGVDGDWAAAESWLCGALRGADAYESIASSGETSLVVSHGYLCRAIIAHAVLKAPVKILRRLRLDNARLATIEMEGGVSRLTSFNVLDVTEIQDDKAIS